MPARPAAHDPWGERIQRIFDRLMIVFFGVVIVVPLVGLVARWDLRGGEEDEKRELASFPRWSWAPAELTTYPQRLDVWFRDHFGFRRLLIRGHSVLTYYVFRTSPSPKVVLGKDGWLFYDGVHAGDGDPIVEYRGIHAQTPYQLETWRWMFQDISDWLEARNARFLVVLVPAKERIYPEYLPDHLTPVGPSASAQVVAYLERHGRFEMLDLAPVLGAARGRELLYAKTDTHWTAYGAYVAYRAIIERLRQWYPAIEPWLPSDVRLRQRRDLAGDLAQMMDLRQVMTEEVPVVETVRPRRATRAKFDDAELRNVVSEVNDPRLPRAVVFRDSFGNALLPFLAEHFRHAAYTWSREGFELTPIMVEQPDLVLHVVGDRVLGRRFRYPNTIQVEANARRFDGASDVLARIDGAMNFQGIRPLRGSSIERSGNDLLVVATTTQAEIEFPAVPRRDIMLPIVRVDVTASGRTDLVIQWDNPRRGRTPPSVRHQVSGRLDRGRNRVTLPLLDPEMIGPLRLQFAHRGKYLLHGIEVRGIPRY